MKIIRIIGRGIKDAGKSVFRNFSLSLASISSTAITLIIVSLAIIFTYNVNSITKHIEDVLTVIVYVENSGALNDLRKSPTTYELPPTKTKSSRRACCIHCVYASCTVG